MKILISLILLALADPCRSAEFQGGREALLELARTWVASETNKNEERINITPPDLRVPIKTCESQLTIRFPFAGNERTLEVLCEKPKWKRYLRVKITDSIKLWVFSDNLKIGTKIQEHHLIQADFSVDTKQNISKLSEIVDHVLEKNVKQGDLVTENILSEAISFFVTKKAYEPGEQIYLKDLALVSGTSSKNKKMLLNWPAGPAIAAVSLETGRPLTKDDVEASDYVVVAKTTVVNGQIITSDLIETRLEPIKALGASPIRDIGAVLGLAASRTLRKGDKIKPSDLVVANLVKKNKKVRLKIQRGIVHITLEAVALENGKMGEQVDLMNPESGRTIQGIVTGRNEARGL